jgi:hypothetical protein
MLILWFGIIGFFVGLIYVIKKRGIRLGNLLSATVLSLVAAIIYKIFKDNFRNGNWRFKDNYKYR